MGNDWQDEIPDTIRAAAAAVAEWRANTPAARKLIDSLSMLDNGMVRVAHQPDQLPRVVTVYWSKSDSGWRVLGPAATGLGRYTAPGEAIHEAFTALWMLTHPDPEVTPA